MCFSVVFWRGLFPRRAKSDIIVYKETFRRQIGNLTFTPPNQDRFLYILNQAPPKVRLKKRHSGVTFYIDEGYHSFINEEPERDDSGWFIDSNRISENHNVRGKFLIPKGTKYYQNKTQRVSENLIYLGPIIPRDENPPTSAAAAA